MVDLPVSVSTSWEPLLAITGSREAFDALHDQTDEESIVQFLVADAGNPGSVVSCVTPSWEPLLAITGSREAFDALHDQTDEESIVQFLVADAGNPGSVVSCVT